MPGRPGGSGGTSYKRDLNNIMSNLNKEIVNIKGATMKGLINAAIYVRNETETKPLVTPVDLGNLRSSWFITTATKTQGRDKWNKGFRNQRGEKGKYTGAKLSNKAAQMASGHSEAITNAKATLGSMNNQNRQFLMMGYSANYAGYVHEFVNPTINWSRKSPQSGAKWFQQHVQSNSQKIFQIIAETSKMKK